MYVILKARALFLVLVAFFLSACELLPSEVVVKASVQVEVEKCEAPPPNIFEDSVSYSPYCPYLAGTYLVIPPGWQAVDVAAYMAMWKEKEPGVDVENFSIIYM